ncbi:general transcription factor 3C polypeptide 6-like [Orbicella faveolata]|uniref:general transcription factor 3C polypeptide 6-like n=1 Tax=Orbicella faveolata TaxID=48498 RepID=UPI0009E1C9EB|nr:general transcription factor 3C polypeptide 6-like [Orbicella faveolata]
MVEHPIMKEHLVVIKLQGVIDNEFLYSCESSNCRLLGIDTDEPVLQIGNYTFIGEFKESLGTHVLFEELASNDAEGSRQLKYKCNTTKTLEMSRVFLVEKEKEKEKEQIPGPSSGADTQQETTDSEG